MPAIVTPCSYKVHKKQALIALNNCYLIVPLCFPCFFVAYIH